MSEQITYDDKVDLIVATNTASINKVTANDMNEIKNAINTNGTTLDNINVPSNWVEVGTTAPTDKKVWFKGSKNLLDMSQVQIGKAWNGDTNTARAVVYMECYPNTNYTISYNNISAFDGMYWVEKTNIGDTSTTYGPSQITDTRTITTKATSHYIVIQFAKTNISLNDFNGVNIQVEQGSVATTYEPYIEQDLIVNGGKFIADQLISVGATNSNDGRRVWFSKSRNDFNMDGKYSDLTLTAQGNATTTKTANKITITTASNNNSGFSIVGATLSTYIDNLDTTKDYYISMDVKANRTLTLGMGVVARPTYSIGTTTQRIQTKTTINGTTGMVVWSTSQTANDTIEISNIMITQNSNAEFEPYVQQGIYLDNEQMHFDDYSTNEQVIGKWIDGKNIYRKTYKVTNISSSNVDLVDVSGLNFDTIIKLYGFVRSQVGMCMPMPLTDSSSNYNVLFLSVNKIRGRVVFGTGGSLKDCYVTIEYTKN